MMRIVIMCFVLVVALSGCGLFGALTEAGTDPQDDPPVTTPVIDPEQTSGLIPGINAGNYPRLDCSTANIPFLARLYSDVCGVPLEDAEALVDASGGTGAVWRNMLWGDRDMLIVYEAPENIKEEIETEGLKLEIEPFGRDGLVFLVNKSNPVDSLTTEQLKGIYSGAITDWGEVGGAPGPISAFQRNEESGSQTLFLKLLMDGLQPMEPPSELVIAGMGGLIEAVAKFDGAGGAIGFSVFYYADLMYANPDLKLLAVDGIAPSNDSIRSKNYPFVNEFFVVVRADEPAGSPTRLLQDWLLSDKGAALLSELNYVPVR